MESGLARLTSSRAAEGQAVLHGWTIHAEDATTPSFGEAAAREIERARTMLFELVERLPSAVDVRILSTARATTARATLQTLYEIKTEGLSLIATPASLRTDLEILASRTGAAKPVAPDTRLPLLWCRGTAAVLFHECAGHAAEAGAAAIRWPEWLTVRDIPETEDDTGGGPQIADLLAGESPRSLRRESFRDVPIPRLSSVVVTQCAPELRLPEQRIEIHLTSGGSYDAVTDLVTIRIASADMVTGDKVTPVVPFTVREERSRIAAQLAGARGGVVRYPGVICGREGQDLYVGSLAPELLQVRG